MADPYGYGGGAERSSHSRRTTQPDSNSGTPNFRWWIPADGIRRDVIQADIQRYLGPEAVVRPGEGRDQDRGRPGYWIAAYRTLTPAMVQDLRADSANFERSGDTGRYENSMVHRSRQHWGPTAEPSSASSDRMPPQSRLEPEPARYQQPTVAPSYSQQPSESSYGYDQQYSRNSDPRGDPRVDPRANHPAPTREYQQYDSRSNAYGTPNSMSSGEYNLAPGHPNYSAGYNPGYAQETGQRTTDARYMDPRSAQTNQPQYSQTGHSSQSTAGHSRPDARAQAPPGFYLASDGRYYPESQKPTT